LALSASGENDEREGVGINSGGARGQRAGTASLLPIIILPAPVAAISTSS